MDVDVAIVGAGAAGLAAARRLLGLCTCVVLEARDRVGGRGHTVDPLGGMPLDMGCGWLHSADRNPFTRIAEDEGLTIDRTPAAWGQAASGFGMTQDERNAFGQAMQATVEAIDRAARAPQDVAVSQLLDPKAPWTPLLNAFSAFYNGAEFDQVSAKDYAAFEDDSVNWRVAEGYGRAIAGLASGLDVQLNTPVAAIDRSGPVLVLQTPVGTVRARAVIVTAPTSLLAAGAIRFTPDLPDWLEAAAGLPLGLADKVHLAFDDAEALPKDAHIFGHTDRTRTGSYYLRPFGRPLIEVYLGGAHARALEAEGEGAAAAFAIEELVGVMGSHVRAQLHCVAASRWANDPWALGSYSHALPGHADCRARLARPVEGRLFFAGEATSPGGFSTAHGAYREGVRTAETVLASR